MGKKGNKSKEKKRQKKLMKKRSKDQQRRKSHGTTVMSENAVQHQMLSNFGNPQNFVKNLQHLAKMFQEDEDLKEVRFDPDKVYAKIDLAESRDALADIYENAEDLTAYDEKYEDFWKDKRKEVLEELVDEDFVTKMKGLFQKMMVTKKGYKKDYRAILAGKLLLDSHIHSLTESPVNENALWELLFNAAIKENIKELPEPAPEPEEKAGEEAPVEEAPAADDAPEAEAKEEGSEE